ncbi:MAG: DNA-processing protein DprA [Microgenomates group bacterium]
MADLYLLGNQKCLQMKRIAVVGTRWMSAYGREMTREFVKKLVENDWCIVSGLARGIDRVAHETALDFKGSTLAVLGHGVDQCYPPEHEGLKKRITENGGLLVSGYGEGVAPTPDKFRARDRLMVHLSQAVLVMECPRRSGVKITVSAAADEGKNVYVVSGPINQMSYHGSVEIIRNGGIPVYSPDDLMAQLKFL